MKISKNGVIHHIEIYVNDLQVSSNFWNWLLEKFHYKLYQQWESGKSWKLNDTYIVLVQTEDKYIDIPYHRCGTGLNHIAVHSDTKEFIDNITEELIKRDINILYKNRHPYAGGENYYAVFFEDPNRIKVEITYSGDTNEK